MSFTKRSFHWVDYCVFALCLAASAGIGLYHAFSGGGQNTKEKYLVGNRQMSLIPVSISLLVSVISANTLLGVPAEMYSYGINFWLLPIGLVPACLGVAFTFVPLLYPLKITSCYEYLEMRFNSPWPKQLGSFLLLIKQMLYVGTVLFGPATALEAVTGLPAFASIIAVSGVATIYTALGGMKAVIWTDVFQSFIMVGGMVAIVIQGSIRVGGMKKVFEINVQDKRVDFSDFMHFDLTKRFNFWSLLIGFFTYWMGEFGINQPTAQRYCAVSTLTKARMSILLNAPGFTVIQTLSALAGITAYAYFAAKGCDPLYTKEITNANQVLPLFTLEVLGYPGLPGLMLACIFSGSLSTVSSSLNSMAACVWEDFLRNRFSYLSESRVTFLMKIMVFIFGAICLGMAFLVASIGGTMIQLSSSFVGMSIGPMLGMYALAGLMTFTNAKGAVLGALLGFAMPLWMLFGYISLGLQNQRLPGRIYACFPALNNTNITSALPFTTPLVSSTTPLSLPKLTGINRLYSVSFVWYPVIGFLITLVAGILISLCTGCNKSEAVGKPLLFPCLRKWVGEPVESNIQCTVIKNNNMELNAEPGSNYNNVGIYKMDHIKERNSYQLTDL